MFEGPYLSQVNVSQKALSTQYTDYFDGLQKGVNNHCQEKKNWKPVWKQKKRLSFRILF